MKIRYKKLDPRAVAPIRGSAKAAGYDLTAIDWEMDTEHFVIVYRTGLAFEIPKGHVGLLFPRSSVFRVHQLLTNCVGVLDSDYRGEVFFKFAFRNGGCSAYKNGERIGQLIVIPIPSVEYEEAKELSKTERGNGGYGSSGK